MKSANWILIASLLIPFSVGAATKNKTAKTVKAGAVKTSSLRTDIRFSGTEVGGRYQTSGEAVTTVENEKPLIDMIEPRREFNDRLRKSVTQR